MLRIINAQRYYDPDSVDDFDEYPEEQLPVVTEDNLAEYTEPEEDIQVKTEPEVLEDYTSFLDEIPVEKDDVSVINDAIMQQQCLGFTYTSTKGRTTWRLVEPHGIYTAIGTGNMLVVTWDRTVASASGNLDSIRAFIIDNIHPGTLKMMPGDFYSFEPKFIFRPR